MPPPRCLLGSPQQSVLCVFGAPTASLLAAHPFMENPPGAGRGGQPQPQQQRRVGLELGTCVIRWGLVGWAGGQEENESVGQSVKMAEHAGRGW